VAVLSFALEPTGGPTWNLKPFTSLASGNRVKMAIEMVDLSIKNGGIL